MRFTKGKQKIEMKKVEAYAARVVTFSKRKSGILKQMSEIVSQCNVETSFLVFSGAGRPYTFAYPSLKEAFGRFKNPSSHEPFASIKLGPLVEAYMEAYKRQKIQDLMQRYDDLVEELEIKNEMEKILKKSKQENKENMWWTAPTEGVSVIKLKWMCQTFEELHVSLSYMALERFGNDGDGSSSSQESCGRDGETYA